VVLPVVPVDVLVKVTVSPAHMVRVLALKFASKAQPCKLIAKDFTVPIQEFVFVSCTVTLPLVLPKVTVI
jgi:hypothetical protein